MFDKKTQAEIEILQAGGRILANVLQSISALVKVGVTGLELDRVATQMILQVGAKPSFKGYHGFPNALCVSVNQTVVHGIPNNQAFQDGDLVGLDIGMEYHGFFTDMATTVAVGEISATAQKLLAVTKEALNIGIAQVKPGVDISEIGIAIEKYVKPFGFGIVRDLTGHGVGRAVHEDPFVPNFACGQKIGKMFPGLVIAIEPMLTAGGTDKVKIAKDHWAVNSADLSQTAHFEHTVAVTETGHLILTK